MMDIDAARAYWASMTHREKLFFVVANGNAASFAYDRLEVHREAARAQMSRIESAIQRSRPDGPEPEGGASQVEIREYVRRGVEHMRPVLYEVHFYFVAWGNCRNMLAILTGQPELLEAKKIFDRHRKDFDHYVAGRNSFEHYHDRLPGRSEEARVKEIRPDPKAGPHRIYSGFKNGMYVHSDGSWDISRASLKLLEDIVDESLAVVHRIIDEEFVRKGMSA
jgi:hypothetical protein